MQPKVSFAHSHACSGTGHCWTRCQDYEKLAIFGDIRGRRGAELKVLSAIETKSPGDGPTASLPRAVEKSGWSMALRICNPNHSFREGLGLLIVAGYLQKIKNEVIDRDKGKDPDGASPGTDFESML